LQAQAAPISVKVAVLISPSNSFDAKRAVKTSFAEAVGPLYTTPFSSPNVEMYSGTIELNKVFPDLVKMLSQGPTSLMYFLTPF